MGGPVIIRNGSVLTGRGPVQVDVRIEGGSVVEIGAGLDGGSGVDATGAWVGPGFVDVHVHFREPGQEWKEDIASGSAAAAAGGFTGVLAMPNTVPAIDSGDTARFVAERGRLASLVDVVPVGSLTKERAGEHLSDLEGLWAAGVRLFSDDGSTVADAGLLRKAMEFLAARGGVVAQHAEDPGLAGGGHMHEGAVSARLGVPGLPSVAEEVVVARDLALVRITGCRYHVQHVSTAGTVVLVARAKEEGLPVTAEVAPHHLSFTEADVLGLDPDYKMYPPLRTEEDRAALRDALRRGVIDAVATDHAPHGEAESDVPFVEAPRGVIGLETAAAAVNETCELDQTTFFRRMSVAPAGIAGLSEHGRPIEVGSPANLVVFDPAAGWVVDRFASKSRNSPWKGATMRGKVLLTMLRGTVTYEAPR